ncbi:MAG: hypothetical protein JSU65_05150, partial [Candidatus Zixiibacteriota bacterium]
MSTSTGSASPGFTVDISTFDFVYWGKGHQVDFRVTPSIHFSYTDSPGPVGSERYGYNVYDPTGGGNWPRGAGVGCEVQPLDVRAGATMMDVYPTGLVVLAGMEVISGGLDNKFYFQPSMYSCFWGSGSAIPPSQYNAGFFDPTSRLHGPKIEIQEWAGDTVLHILATESECFYTTQNLRETVVSYFRKVGSGASGSWEGPVIIDTAAWCWSG